MRRIGPAEMLLQFVQASQGGVEGEVLHHTAGRVDDGAVMSAVDAEIDADAIFGHAHPSRRRVEQATAALVDPRAQRCVFVIRGRGPPRPNSPNRVLPGDIALSIPRQPQAPHPLPRRACPQGGPFLSTSYLPLHALRISPAPIYNAPPPVWN